MENLLLAEHSTSPYLINPSFSGHQTFPFRYTWLKKGVDAVMDNPNVFTDDDAPVILGVGKNMVSSIRHWCSVSGLIEKRKTLLIIVVDLKLPTRVRLSLLLILD